MKIMEGFFMTKIQKSLTASLCLVMFFSLIFSEKNNKTAEKQLMFFPGLSFGCSVEADSDKNAKILEKDDDIEFSFRIFEMISDWFS